MNHAGLYAIKPRFQQVLDGPADLLAHRGVHPDVLTYAGVACGLLGGAALLGHALWLVPLFAATRLIFNALDGMVALRSGLARPWGKVLNEFGDRLADVAFFAPLLLLVPETVLTASALIAMLLVSFLGVLAAAAGAPREYGGVMGKADRMLWLGLATAATAVTGDLLWLRLLAVVLLGGSLITLVQRGGRIHAAV